MPSGFALDTVVLAVSAMVALVAVAAMGPTTETHSCTIRVLSSFMNVNGLVVVVVVVRD